MFRTISYHSSQTRPFFLTRVMPNGLDVEVKAIIKLAQVYFLVFTFYSLRGLAIMMSGFRISLT